MRALFSESAHLEPNTSSHASHHCTLDPLGWREGKRVSPSSLPVVLHPCPSSSPPLLAVIANGLGTPHGSRKQRSHFTSWYTIAHRGDDDACFTLRRASYLPCGRCEGVQGALTLFCRGAAQTCHDDRVVELREQLEMENKTEKEVRSKETRHEYDRG